jgi:hypothetical protein
MNKNTENSYIPKHLKAKYLTRFTEAPKLLVSDRTILFLKSYVDYPSDWTSIISMNTSFCHFRRKKT